MNRFYGQCQICSEELKNAILFQCGHKFCLRCIKPLNQYLECFICNTLQQLPSCRIHKQPLSLYHIQQNRPVCTYCVPFPMQTVPINIKINQMKRQIQETLQKCSLIEKDIDITIRSLISFRQQLNGSIQIQIHNAKKILKQIVTQVVKIMEDIEVNLKLKIGQRISQCNEYINDMRQLVKLINQFRQKSKQNKIVELYQMARILRQEIQHIDIYFSLKKTNLIQNVDLVRISKIIKQQFKVKQLAKIREFNFLQNKKYKNKEKILIDEGKSSLNNILKTPSQYIKTPSQYIKTPSQYIKTPQKIKSPYTQLLKTRFKNK